MTEREDLTETSAGEASGREAIPIWQRPIPDRLDYFATKLTAQADAAKMPHDTWTAIAATVVNLGAIAAELRKRDAWKRRAEETRELVETWKLRAETAERELAELRGRIEWGVRWTDQHGETHDDAKADEAKAREFVQIWQKRLPDYAAVLISRMKAGEWQEVPDGA